MQRTHRRSPTLGLSHNESRGIMQARPWTTTIASAAALLALAGCATSPAPAPVESDQIDWDIAVTRTAFHRSDSLMEQRYNPWTHEIFIYGEEDSAQPVPDENLTTGIEWLCDQLDRDNEPMGARRLTLELIAREAVNAVLLPTMSEEFREANSALLTQASHFPADGESPAQEALDAVESLRGELHGEWLELWDAQSELEQEVFTLEGARAAQEALADRCDVPVDNIDIADVPGDPRAQPALVGRPSSPEVD